MGADHSFITDRDELEYISNVVNQILSKPQELSSIEDFQAAVAKKSSELGREVRVNLVVDQNRVTGMNFSFADDPAKTTPTISFSPQEKELAKSSGQLLTDDKSGTLALGNHLNANQSGKGASVAPPPQQVEQVRENPENPDSLKSPPLRGKMNLGLAREAEKLAARQELDGLWLTGNALKTVTTLAQLLEKKDPIDKQAAGNAIIGRFEQVSPERFAALKAGDSPKPFNWRDPSSKKLYRFEFETAAADGSTPYRLQGLAIDGSSKTPVFSALSHDAKHWSIEQCDLSQQQLRSLNQAQRPTKALSTVSTRATKVGGLEC